MVKQLLAALAVLFLVYTGFAFLVDGLRTAQLPAGFNWPELPTLGPQPARAGDLASALGKLRWPQRLRKSRPSDTQLTPSPTRQLSTLPDANRAPAATFGEEQSAGVGRAMPPAPSTASPTDEPAAADEMASATEQSATEHAEEDSGESAANEAHAGDEDAPALHPDQAHELSSRRRQVKNSQRTEALATRPATANKEVLPSALEQPEALFDRPLRPIAKPRTPAARAMAAEACSAETVAITDRQEIVAAQARPFGERVVDEHAADQQVEDEHAADEQAVHGLAADERTVIEPDSADQAATEADQVEPPTQDRADAPETEAPAELAEEAEPQQSLEAMERTESAAKDVLTTTQEAAGRLAEAPPGIDSDSSHSSAPRRIDTAGARMLEADPPIGAACTGESCQLEPLAANSAAEPQNAFADHDNLKTVQASPEPREMPANGQFAPSRHGFAEEQHLAAIAEQSESEQGDVVLRWITPHEVSIGQQVHCQLVVRNTGHTAVQNVAVRATLSKSVQLDDARPRPKQEDRQLTWQLGEIAALATRTIEIEVTPQAEGEIAPQATVIFTRQTSARIAVLKADLAMTIEGPKQIISGQSANYQFVVTNPGRGRAHNVVIEAVLGQQLKSPEGSKLSYSIGTLGPGESRTVQVPITAAAAGRWKLASRATASGKLHVEQTQPIEVVRPRLQVAIEGPRLRYVDRQAIYTVKVHNPGPAPANNVQVFDIVPAGFRFVEASGGGTFDHANRHVAWFVGRLEAGTTAEVGVQLIPTETGPKRVAAEVKADSGVVELAETETRVEGIATVVLDIVDTDDPIEVNGQTAYEIRVTNRGTQPANQVQVAAKLPQQLEAVDVSGATPGRITTGQVVFEPIATLAPGQSELYRVRVVCREVGQVGFRAYFRSAEQQKPVLAEEVTQIYQD